QIRLHIRAAQGSFVNAHPSGHSKDAAVPRDVAGSGYSGEETDRLQLMGVTDSSRSEARQRSRSRALPPSPDSRSSEVKRWARTHSEGRARLVYLSRPTILTRVAPVHQQA